MRFITLSLFATLLSAPAFAADLGTYRPGKSYNSTVADGADVCDNQCAGDAQCRGWNYVKPNPRAAGICEFLSSVSAPIASQISISGESASAAPFSSRLTTGSTNTVRVGTQSTPRPNTVRVGQGAPSRKVVREAAPERIVLQRTSTRPVENMSLTEQQNRYRNARAATAQRAPQPQARQYPTSQQQAYTPAQRQMFRPILDAAGRPVPTQVPGQHQGQHIHQTQPQNRPVQSQAPRRATGPRRVPAQGQPMQGQGYAAPQFHDPRAQNLQTHDPRARGQQFQAPQQVAQRGHSRPPVGQPIPAPELPIRPQPSTPSQRLAKLTADTRAQASTVPSTGPVALSPEQARTSLFGKMNDDLRSDLPMANAVPTQPVTEQFLGEVLAGGR